MDLANSIQSLGLFHPIVTRNTANGSVLVAGERRLRALGDLHALGVVPRFNGADIPPDHAPTIDLGELDELSAEEAELDENLRRKDLTWQESASAIARLHSLRKAQAQAQGSVHTISDTVEAKKALTGAADHQSVRAELLVARHLSNPEVAKAKTAKDALKILKKQEDRKNHEELASRVGATFTSAAHQLRNEDCIGWLTSFPGEVFDIILTDPPYGMGADSFGDGGGKLSNSEHHYEDSYEAWVELISALAPQLYRVAKPQAHAYIFCDIDRFHELRDLMQQAGWYVFRTPIINHKPNSGRVPLPEHGPRRQYEICLYAIKGKKPVTGIYSDVITTRLEENLTHGAQKPVELYIDLLRRSAKPGDLVLDCFAGSGTIFPAANDLKLIATGIELSPEYYAIAYKRLEALS